MSDIHQKLCNMQKKHKITLVIGIVLALGIGFGLGYGLKPAQIVSSKALRENNDKYTFIHPLLAVNRADTKTPTPEYNALYKKVQTFINTQISTHQIDIASVYFINYGKTSGSFGVNEEQTYAPASLLKVVLMVAYLKKSDEDSNILDQQFAYAVDIAHSIESVPFEDPTKLKIGQSYTVSTLIDKMIIDSDNGAMNLLLAHIDDLYLTQVFTDLGLHGPDVDSEYAISAKDYSLFFRVLYNATYLSKAGSEKALSILSKTTFVNGLTKGLPDGILVAHKYGEHVNGEDGQIDSVELHDCGMIYNPDGPYLLCTMTRGKTLDSLSASIAGISKMIYDNVSSDR